MAIGTMSSLGLGSGVLTYDVIDKLRKADEDARLKPIDKKVERNTEKQTELSGLMTLLSTMKNSAAYLSDTSSYLERDTSVIGDGISAISGAGLIEQDIKIEVERLAKNDVYEVSGKRFNSREDVFSLKNSNISFYHNNTFYTVPVKSGATLEEVSQSITDETNGAVLGSVMKVGGDKPYQLMISSKEKGDDNKIYFGNTSLSNAINSGSLGGESRGALNVTLKNQDGEDITLDIKLPETKEHSTTIDNATALRDALRDAIKKEPTLKDMLFDRDNIDTQDDRNRPIKIDLNSDGTRIVINDSRGEDIKVGGSQASSLGFSEKLETKSDTVVGSSVTTYGKMKIDFSIGDISIKLTTNQKNTPLENAQDIADAINKSTKKSNVTASVNSDNNSIILTHSKGEDINIIVNGSNDKQKFESAASIEAAGLKSGTYSSEKRFLQNELDVDNIQVAVDSKFKYNDISMTRSGNYVDDIVSGLSITLERTHKEGDSATIRVAQNTDKLIEEVEGFIEGYNEAISSLAQLTRYDEDTGVAGIFQGESNVTSIRGSLNSVLFFSDAQGRSLINYGVYLNEDGTLEYDSDKLASKIKAEPESTKDFFKGYSGTINGKDSEFDGVFTKFTTQLESLLVDKEGGKASLKSYETSLENELDKLRDERSSALKIIESRYEIMAMRFASYDAIIGQINSNFQALQMQIDAMAGSK